MTNYIFEYYQGIQSGEIVVGRWIRLWYQYIVKGLEQKSFFYSAKKATRAVRFIETFCRHNEGRNDLMKLELWQKALISVIFGIVDEEGIRTFSEILIIIARKNGKTLLCAAISAYAATLDGEYGGRIYFISPKLEQAKICYNGLCEMIRTDPDLSQLARKRRDDLYFERWNTTAKPLAFNSRKSDGLNPSVLIADEIASWPGQNGLRQYNVNISAAGARKQPLFISISTAGYESEGIYDALFKRATALLIGNSKEKHFAPFIYQIDDVDKWNDINEWPKSNPNLGVSISVDTLIEAAIVAETDLVAKAEFLCKRCNIKQNATSAWLSAQAVEALSGVPFGLDDLRGCYCVVGIDLSQTTDLTAAVVLIEKNKLIHAIAHFWLPSKKIEEATARDGLPYQQYIERGFLSPSGENFVDYHDVERYITDLVTEYEILPLKIGYDRYSAQYLIQDLKGQGFHCDDVYQGPNLTPVIDEATGLIADGTIRIGDNDLFKVHLLNSAIKYSPERNRKQLVKIEANASTHIDATAALLDALCMRQKYADEISAQLRNESAETGG